MRGKIDLSTLTQRVEDGNEEGREVGSGGGAGTG